MEGKAAKSMGRGQLDGETFSPPRYCEFRHIRANRGVRLRLQPPLSFCTETSPLVREWSIYRSVEPFGLGRRCLKNSPSYHWPGDDTLGVAGSLGVPIISLATRGRRLRPYGHSARVPCPSSPPSATRAGSPRSQVTVGR